MEEQEESSVSNTSESGHFKSQYNRARMIVSESISVCQDRIVRRFVLSANPFGENHGGYLVSV